ncbi:MAG: 50S ribosomal protein L10 [bacterium]|nr:50S ribosomal protein L10 [bacterium]
MLTKSQKIKLVIELADILKNNTSILFVDFSGLNMGEIIGLKKELKKENIKFKALKKSLLGFAFEKSGREEFDLSSHKNSVAIVYGDVASDAIMAKIVHKFSVQTKKLAILGGFLMGEKMLKNAVVVLAQLPAREVLLAQVVQLLMSPVSGFARVLDGISKQRSGS